MEGSGASVNASMTDATLMHDLAQGQIAALGPLYERHGRMVKTVLLRMEPGLQLEQADDLAQEVFLTLAKTAGRYHEQNKLKGWLCGIASRRLKGWRRKRWTRGRLLRIFGSQGAGVAMTEPPAPDETAAARQALDRALASLPEDWRHVLVLHHMEGLPAEQIGAALGISTNTVWTRLFRARKRMKQALEER